MLKGSGKNSNGELDVKQSRVNLVNSKPQKESF